MHTSVLHFLSPFLKSAIGDMENSGKRDIQAPLGFSGSSIGKESAYNAGDHGLIPGPGRSAGEGIGYPL